MVCWSDSRTASSVSAQGQYCSVPKGSSTDPRPQPYAFVRWNSSVVCWRAETVLRWSAALLVALSELALIIGKEGRAISEERAMDHVFG